MIKLVPDFPFQFFWDDDPAINLRIIFEEIGKAKSFGITDMIAPWFTMRASLSREAKSAVVITVKEAWAISPNLLDYSEENRLK